MFTMKVVFIVIVFKLLLHDCSTASILYSELFLNIIVYIFYPITF